MFTATRLLVASALIAGMTPSGATAQPPKAIELKMDGVTIRVTNIEVVTGEEKPWDGKLPHKPLPEKPVPVAAGKLLPPTAGVWITFDYETNFKKSDAPDGLSFLAVGYKPSGLKAWGSLAADINGASGRGTIWITELSAGPKAVDINEALKLTAYGRTNRGQNKSCESEATIPFKFRVDGRVTLSATQFEELQATIRKVAELEKKVQALEGKK